MIYNAIKHVLPRFAFQGKYKDVEELHSGNINNTYHLLYELPDGSHNEYALQHINSYVFKDPTSVMHNIELVCNHLRSSYETDGMDPKRRMLELIPVHDNGVLYIDESGGFWRAYHYIVGATAHDQVSDPALFLEAGRGFGEFQRRLNDFPAEKLSTTIPDFHDTTKRFYAFVASLAKDPVGRAKYLEKEIDFLFDRRKMMGAIIAKIEDGTIPLRVTHNDTKINNVMIDDATKKALCVIDLDTVMPGCVLFDFGDAIRFGASTAKEDESDLSKISLNMNLFAQFTKGFLSEAGDLLTQDEVRLLPLGVEVMTAELMMRFLTDYIDGDPYFRINSPDHNLIRARAQMRLLEDIEAKYGDMCDVVAELA